MKIVSIPWDNGNMNTNSGCKNAPNAIIKEMKNIFLNEEGKKVSFEVETVVVNENNFEETNTAIYEKIKSLDEKAIILGGDHSITYAAVKAFAEKNPNAGVLMIDAHPDCESDFLPPTHEDFIRGIINQNIIAPENILLVGIRNWHNDEEAFLKKHGIRTITMKDVGYDGFKESVERMLTIVEEWDSLYLSLDIDAVDPAFAPATGYPEPAGFTAREFITLVQKVKKLKNLKMADLVEINPEIDVNNMTVKLGAKVVTELL